MARSEQRRGSALAGARSEHDEYDEYRVSSPEHSEDRCCGHRLLSVVPIVSIRVEGGYAGRCLLCGTTGPIRANAEAARLELLDQMVRDDQ